MTKTKKTSPSKKGEKQKGHRCSFCGSKLKLIHKRQENGAIGYLECVKCKSKWVPHEESEEVDKSQSTKDESLRCPECGKNVAPLHTTGDPFSEDRYISILHWCKCGYVKVFIGSHVVVNKDLLKMWEQLNKTK